jgi:glycosyltransferase involved in cell wall biosynthesis
LRVALQGSLGVYGVETFVNRLSFHLGEIGFDVATLAPFGRLLFRAGKSRLILQGGSGNEIHWRRAFAESNIVHLNYALISLPLLLRTPSTLPPIVYTVHGLPQPELESQPMYKIGYIFEKASLRHIADRATKVVAISNYLRDLLKKIYGIDALVIRNGVDTGIFYPLTQSERRKIRSHLQIPLDKRIILFVGRLHPYKDPMTLVRCMPTVVRKNPDAYFVMVGDGPLNHALSSEVMRLGLEKCVKLIPRLALSKLVEWFQVSDLFVSTSPGEMLGFTVLEAMSSGIPVVAAISGGPAELLGPSGTFFKPRDDRDLAEKIFGVLSDKRSAVESGQKAREIVLRDFRWEDVANRYGDLYRSVASRG